MGWKCGFSDLMKFLTGGVWEQRDKEKYFDVKEAKNTYIILKL
jgi:hypothetical protein